MDDDDYIHFNNEDDDEDDEMMTAEISVVVRREMGILANKVHTPPAANLLGGRGRGPLRGGGWGAYTPT